MADIINTAIQAYAEAFSEPEDELLREINNYTQAHHKEHHMLSGHLQGKLLQMISWMVRPRRILEIGTFTGYSALCLAKGLVEEGKLHTIELREKDAALAKQFFDRSVYADKVILHIGNAKEVIPQLREQWDLVFIDADKVSYQNYFDLILPQVRKNGFILVDNVFFHGEVIEQEAKSKSGKAIKAFNEYIRQQIAVDKMMLTLRDGLYLLRKL